MVTEEWASLGVHIGGIYDNKKRKKSNAVETLDVFPNLEQSTEKKTRKRSA